MLKHLNKYSIYTLAWQWNSAGDASKARELLWAIAFPQFQSRFACCLDCQFPSVWFHDWIRGNRAHESKAKSKEQLEAAMQAGKLPNALQGLWIKLIIQYHLRCWKCSRGWVCVRWCIVWMSSRTNFLRRKMVVAAAAAEISEKVSWLEGNDTLGWLLGRVRAVWTWVAHGIGKGGSRSRGDTTSAKTTATPPVWGSRRFWLRAPGGWRGQNYCSRGDDGMQSQCHRPTHHPLPICHSLFRVRVVVCWLVDAPLPRRLRPWLTCPNTGGAGVSLSLSLANPMVFSRSVFFLFGRVKLSQTYS